MVFVAMEIGSGGIGSTSTRSSRRSVTQMLSPLSTIDGVDPSSNACIGIFVTVKAKNLWQANKTCDAVHREPVCVEFIGQERSRVISQREWEFEGSSMRCRTDEDPGVGE